MQPLSIEAIKQLKEDDWVYFILINENGKENECSYFQVSRVWEDCIRFYGTYRKFDGDYLEYIEVDIKDYGKTWVAYKNKEQADCKSELIDKNKVIKFIEELAWKDVQYDAFQSVMDTSKASLTAIPRYTKKYFELWKELFDEKLKELRGENG